jgi:hypothetical protein
MAGAASLKFIVHRAGPDSGRLPAAATCFATLYLPEYNNRDKLEAKLAKAIALAGQGW